MKVWVAQHRERPEDVRVFRRLAKALAAFSETVVSWRMASEDVWLGVDEHDVTTTTLHLRVIEDPQ